MLIDVRAVTEETRHEFAAIVGDANAWQKGIGSEGWNKPFDDEWMLPRIERRELYLTYLETEAVAAFRLVWDDKQFWGDREVGDSIYLHTFAVRRSHAGRGIGQDVIQWVARFGRDHGRARLRLDCFRSNTGLVAFYERNGFISVGCTTVQGRTMNLMERPIETSH